MTRYLVATASGGTTAAACDYLEPKVEDTDEVYVLTVEGEGDGDGSPAEGDREVGLTDAQVRLSAAEVRTIRREGTPHREILGFARERDVDEVIVGARRGGAGLGETARAVLEKTDRPVFVVSPGP